jgi:TolA-binding protein
MKIQRLLLQLLMSVRIQHIGLLCLLAGLLVLGQGCAYYNTFYDAKKDYEAGERANRNKTAGQSRDVQNYRKCIETGSKLLELYPKSRWVDDCLLLMGKAYFRSGEFPKAQRKFEELISNFPKSKLVPEARLWLAQTLLQMKRPTEALTILEQLRAAPQAKAFWAQASSLMGGIQFDAGHYADAATAYQEASQRYRNKAERARALYMLGRSLYMQNNFQEAQAAFERVPKLRPSRELIFLSMVELGRCKAELGDPKGAIELLLRLQKDIQFQNYSSGIELTLAKISAGQGDYDEATRTYQNYLQTNPNGEGKAEAFYRLGVIYRDYYRDLHQAAAYFDSVQSAGVTGGLVDSAKAEAQILHRGLTYIQRWKDAEAKVQSADSLKKIPSLEQRAAAPSRVPETPDTTVQSETDTTQVVGMQDTTGKTAPQDTLPAAPAPVEQPLSPEDVYTAKKNLQRALFDVGEFFWHDLGMSDSASYFFKRAAQDTFDQETRWKANLILAELAQESGASDEEIRRYYEVVLTSGEVPIKARNQARAALGLPLTLEAPDTLHEKYLELERSILDTTSRPDSLLSVLQVFLSMDPSWPDYPRLLFAKAYLYENRLKNMDSARAAYETLIALYPDSAFSATLAARLDTTQLQAEAEEQLQTGTPSEADTLKTSTEEGWPPPEETLLGRRGR